MLVHIANNDLTWAFNGIIQDDVPSGTDTENDIIGLDFQDLVIYRRIFPANVVNVGTVTDRVDHIETFSQDCTNDEVGTNDNDSPCQIRIKVDRRVSQRGFLMHEGNQRGITWWAKTMRWRNFQRGI